MLKELTLGDLYCVTVWSLLAPLFSTSNTILLGVNAVLGFQRLSELYIQKLSLESHHWASMVSTAKMSGRAKVTIMTVSLVRETFMYQWKCLWQFYSSTCLTVQQLRSCSVVSWLQPDSRQKRWTARRGINGRNHDIQYKEVCNGTQNSHFSTYLGFGVRILVWFAV